MRTVAKKGWTRLWVLLCALFLVFSACGVRKSEADGNAPVMAVPEEVESTPEPSLAQLELLDPDYSESDSEIAGYDFKNHTYPLPRGWQNADGTDLELTDGFRRTTEDKIGMEFLSARYFDVTGDGEDEAVVMLKIGTGGSALPHLVYVFRNAKDEDEPELIWYFRTGDRADGGLKNIYPEDGDLIIELFGKDRYILGQMETLRITGDEVQLCCPTHFTKTRYQWTNGSFRMKGERLTFDIAEPESEGESNLGDNRSGENE